MNRPRLTPRDMVVAGVAVWLYPVMEHLIVERLLGRSILDPYYRRNRP